MFGVSAGDFYLQFFMGTPEGHQKIMFNTYLKDVHMGYIRQSLQAQPKNKEIIETPNQPIEIKKISNKSMFSTSKAKRRQKFI
jgi:hypothetical protein